MVPWSASRSYHVVMKLLRVTLLSAFALAICVAMAAPPAASEILKSAQKDAKAAKKNVMVIFHASWCGWCKKLDAFLADPKMGKMMTDSYVIVHLDVLENPDKKELENAGAMDLMQKWGGGTVGLPFTVVLDPSGKMVSSSLTTPMKPNTNIGYPAAPEEITYFMTMLKATAPRMGGKQRGDVETWLKTNAPKH
jgi:thiol:disulfide interchange protein